MVNLLRYCCINCSVICCIFWIFWPADKKRENMSHLLVPLGHISKTQKAKTILQPVGSTVTLNCSNNTINTSGLVIWKMNGKRLFSLGSRGNKTQCNESVCHNLKMSESRNQLFALIIEDAQKQHEGNYTCETATSAGVLEETWELKIQEENESNILNIIVIAAVPSVCIVILVSVLVILTVWKQRKKNRPPTEIRQQKQPEDIYENHLEIQRRQAYRHQP